MISFGQPSVWGGLVAIPTQRGPHAEEHPWVLSDVPSQLLEDYADELQETMRCRADGPCGPLWTDLALILLELGQRAAGGAL